jgi:hypothetical protein
MRRLRFVLAGAMIGLAWAASLRGFMSELAGPDSTFTYAGTFGVILPSGTAVGALLGWAEYQRRAGPRHPSLILSPLVLGVVPLVALGSPDPAPIVLALLAMIGGYAVSGRGPRWARIVAGLAAIGSVLAPFLASEPFPDLSFSTAHGAWFDTLSASLYVTLALACAIPMLPAADQGGTSGSGRTAAAGQALEQDGDADREEREELRERQSPAERGVLTEQQHGSGEESPASPAPGSANHRAGDGQVVRRRGEP